MKADEIQKSRIKRMIFKHTMPLFVPAVIAVSAALCVQSAHAEGAEKGEVRVSIEKVPAAAKAALKRESKGAAMPILQVDQETMYETDVMIAGKNYEIRVAGDDGDLISKKIDNEKEKAGEAGEKGETKVSLSQVPKGAKATLLREAKGAKIGSVDKETVYEADAVIHHKNYEIIVAKDGEVLSKKVDNGD